MKTLILIGRSETYSIADVLDFHSRESITLFSQEAIDLTVNKSIYYSGGFDVIEHQELWRPLLEESFEQICIISAREYHLETQLVTLCSLLNRATIKFIQLEASHSVSDITGICEKLRYDFTDSEVRYEVLNREDQDALLASMHENSINNIRNSNYLIKSNSTEQSSRNEHFENNVGLVEDLIMRSEELNKHPWWTFPQTIDDTFVRSVDVRLSYALMLSKLPDVKSAVEVGSGSGFVSHYLFSLNSHMSVEGTEISPRRVKGANLFSQVHGLNVKFQQSGADKLPYATNAVDLVHSCFVLEQCNSIIDQCLDELFRVSKKFVVLFEPSEEHFSTLPGYIHLREQGFPTGYGELLRERGISYFVLRPPLRHYYNPGVLYIACIDTTVDLNELELNFWKQSNELIKTKAS